MNEFIGEITLDLDCRKTMPKISVGQFDKGRKYLIRITANGQSFSASGSTVIIQGMRSDKSRFSATCSIDQTGNVILILSEEMLSKGGYAYAKLVLSDSSKNYSTQVFVIDIDSSYEGDITPEENYSLVNDFVNRLMLLFDLESPADMLAEYSSTKCVQLNGNNPYPNVNTAIDKGIIYRCFGSGSNSPRGWLVFCGDKNYVGATVSQFRADREGNFYFRTGTANSGTVTWASNTWTPFTPASRTIAGIDLQDNITAAELNSALGNRGFAIITDETVPASANWNGVIPNTFAGNSGEIGELALFYDYAALWFLADNDNDVFEWYRLLSTDDLHTLMKVAPVNPTAAQIEDLPNGQLYGDTVNHKGIIKGGQQFYDTSYIQLNYNTKDEIGVRSLDCTFTVNGADDVRISANKKYSDLISLSAGNAVVLRDKSPLGGYTGQSALVLCAYNINSYSPSRVAVACVTLILFNNEYSYQILEPTSSNPLETDYISLKTKCVIPNDFYTKTEIDSMIGNVETLLSQV